MTEENKMTKEQFESAIHRLTQNERVIAALLKCFETGDFTKRPELGLFITDKKEFDTIMDWVMKSGWLK